MDRMVVAAVNDVEPTEVGLAVASCSCLRHENPPVEDRRTLKCRKTACRNGKT